MTKRPKPRPLAKQFKTALQYRNRPEGPHEPLGSNWTTTAANSNTGPEELEALSHERKILITPSVDEIMRQVETGDVEKNAKGQTIRIGNLHFSDGTQTEKAFKRRGGRTVVEYDRVMPVGAMLRSRENTEGALGGKGYDGEYRKRSNNYFADSFDADVPAKAERGKRKNGRGFSRDETQAMLDEAIANTPVMPPVKRYPAGLPATTELLADNFNGMKVDASGGSGSTPWQDISAAMVQREIWDEALAQMKSADIATLDKLQTAGTWSDIGNGGHERSAGLRQGKANLSAANDNLAAAIKNSSAA